MVRISIFGLGYVGLATAVCLARKGHQVVGIDPDREKVEKIQGGIAPFFEPDLDASLKKAVSQQALTARADPSLNPPLLLVPRVLYGSETWIVKVFPSKVTLSLLRMSLPRRSLVRRDDSTLTSSNLNPFMETFT